MALVAIFYSKKIYILPSGSIKGILQVGLVKFFLTTKTSKTFVKNWWYFNNFFQII